MAGLHGPLLVGHQEELAPRAQKAREAQEVRLVQGGVHFVQDGDGKPALEFPQGEEEGQGPEGLLPQGEEAEVLGALPRWGDHEAQPPRRPAHLRPPAEQGLPVAAEGLLEAGEGLLQALLVLGLHPFGLGLEAEKGFHGLVQLPLARLKLFLGLGQGPFRQGVHRAQGL